MLENILTSKNLSLKLKITVKGLVSATLVALAVALPQIIHLAFGQAGGVQWLPMYLPVLLGGCLLGAYWGLGIGLASPLISFLLTSLCGDAMPVAERLPFMMAELAVFATVSGLFSKKIYENGWLAFPAVLLAQVAGRATFMLLAVIFDFTPQLIWAQIQSGLLAVVLQAVAVPFAVMGIRLLLKREKKND